MALVDTSTGELLKPTFDWESGVHPAADLFPMMDPAAFFKLCEDVKANGLIEPIWLDSEGRLLDGRNRLAACQANGIDPEARTYRGDDAVGFVLSLNVNRRHLTTGQLAMVAADSVPLYEEQAKVRQISHLNVPESASGDADSEGGRSAGKAAEAVGTSRPAVNRAQRVQREAPELAEKVRAGEITLNSAHEQVKRDVTPIFKSSTQKLAAAEKKVRNNQHTVDGTKRLATFEKLAAKGYDSDQIAVELGLSREGLRGWRTKNGIDAPPADAIVGGTRRVDANRVIAATVAAAEPTAGLIELVDYSKLDRSQLAHWESSLTQSISSLTTIRNNLRKELSRD